MLSECEIFVDRLSEGGEELIEWTLSSTFLDIHEHQLSFTPEVLVNGRAYLADTFLIIQVDIQAIALIPCIVCNEIKNQPIAVDELYHAEPLDDIKGKIFNFTEKLRDAILLEVPQFYECNNGNCGERKELEKFLKKDPLSSPFADL
jgi:hypothetical protein